MTYRSDDTARAGHGLTLDVTHHEFAVLETVPVGIAVLRADATLIYANEAAHALFETGEQELVLVDTLCPTDASEIQDHLHEGGQFEALVANERHHRHVKVSIAELGPDFVLSITDITDLKRANQRAEFLAHHDPLTRLGNRTLLQSVWEVVEERLSSGGFEVHAMALDLDHFKQVNDLHGHATGDVVLREAAGRLQLVVGDAGHVFRFGGDEFFVLVDDVPLSLATEIAQAIVDEMRRPMTVMGQEITIGCSVGIASGPSDGTTRDALHRAADLALYEVKRAGRGDVACFDPAQEQELLNQRLIQADLILALAGDALDIAFLPQVNSRTGKVEAFDTAVSWRSRRMGRLLGNGELLALADETGLRHILDLWTMRTAIARFAQQQSGARPNLSLTFSATTLAREETPAIVADALAEHGLAANRLEVQISESAVLAGGDALTGAIGRLRDLGVQIVIDGLFAQRPALGYLRSLGVQRVKFHRRVAQTMLGDDDADADALIGSTWILCQRLGIELSTDGLETPQQLEGMRRLGRIRAQGPLFADRIGPDVSGDADAPGEAVA